MNKTNALKFTDTADVPEIKHEAISVAIASSPMPMILTDPTQPDNPIIFANEAFLALTEYSAAEVIGRNCRFLQGPDTDPATRLEIAAALSAGKDVAVEILNYKKSGTPFWNALYISPALDETGTARYFFACQLDCTDKRKIEQERIEHKTRLEVQEKLESLVKSRTYELEQALATSRMLMHEVDHRVKNNLQMVSAMIMLQALRIPDEGIRNTLQEMLERVDALGLVHKQLYQSDSILDFELSDCIGEIASNLILASGRGNIDLELDLKSVKIKADNAAPVAIIVNEVITNALKHAFPIGASGNLTVGVRPKNDHCQIIITDNGVGLGNSPVRGTGFGSSLIETLSRQVKANVYLTQANPGTRIEIHMPI